jgi:hypothetical protein
MWAVVPFEHLQTPLAICINTSIAACRLVVCRGVRAGLYLVCCGAGHRHCESTLTASTDRPLCHDCIMHKYYTSLDFRYGARNGSVPRWRSSGVSCGMYSVQSRMAESLVLRGFPTTNLRSCSVMSFASQTLNRRFVQYVHENSGYALLVLASVASTSVVHLKVGSRRLSVRLGPLTPHGRVLTGAACFSAQQRGAGPTFVRKA